ncbi:hypothetical protein SCHPADRAFT_936297 [Schizopora paradoxa]|uniref:Uncharacterized protein n=1 Tax=Schizopora paradoxa TaxID=27342 RepID=A0A0H2S955_9AGAM|nr:hypothetical protein SCHPADRAFT_936297 [Schizopora paradoxa]
MATRKSRTKRGQKKHRVEKCISGETESGYHSDEELEQSPSVAHLLPLEVLHEIFLHAVPSEHHGAVRAATLQQWRTFFSNVFPVNLTLVCRPWRAAAIDTPGIWSSWYMEVHSPSKKALLVMKRFLACVLGRSLTVNLTIHLRFTGTFDFLQACNAIVPILEYQERWEDVDIDFGVEQGCKNDLVCPLGTYKLQSLRNLRLTGRQWDSHRSPPDTPHPHPSRPMPRLHTLSLDSMHKHVLFDLVSTSQNLVVLSICLHEDYRSDTRLELPALRRLGLRKAPSYEGDHFHLILSNLHCLSLRELSIENISSLPFHEYAEFVLRNGLANTLLSLRLIFSPSYIWINTPGVTEDGVASILRLLNVLRELAISGGMNDESLEMMGQFTAERFLLCPLLEDFVLDYVTVADHLYSELVNARWNGPRRRIKALTFISCGTRSARGIIKPLSQIPVADTFVQNGLKLNILPKLTDEMKDYGLEYPTIDCCQR